MSKHIPGPWQMDAQTPVFTFKRVQRNCASDKPVYDYDVLLNGARIATWSRDMIGRGYVLRDSGEKRVRDPERHYRRACSSKADFQRVTSEWLFYIPSPLQVGERERVDAEKKAAGKRERAERERIYRIEQAGPSLLAALKAMVSAYHEPETPEQDEAHAMATRAMLEALTPEGEDGGM